MEKIIAIHNVLKEKNYKPKFLTRLIFIKKIKKENFEKNHNKKTKRKKNHARKHYSNL